MRDASLHLPNANLSPMPVRVFPDSKPRLDSATVRADVSIPYSHAASLPPTGRSARAARARRSRHVRGVSAPQSCQRRLLGGCGERAGGGGRRRCDRDRDPPAGDRWDRVHAPASRRRCDEACPDHRVDDVRVEDQPRSSRKVSSSNDPSKRSLPSIRTSDTFRISSVTSLGSR